MRGHLTGTAVGIAVLIALVGTSVAGRSVATRRSGMQQLAIGYESPSALSHALAATHATLVRNLRPLRVAQVRGAEAAVLRRQPGIRFVQHVSPRIAAATEPAFSLAASPEWQLRAVHADTVPDTVLRAAGSFTIAVVDTGADLTAPDLAAKSPLAWNTRSGRPTCAMPTATARSSPRSPADRSRTTTESPAPAATPSS